jgi:hypothetical protein
MESSPQVQERGGQDEASEGQGGPSGAYRPAPSCGMPSTTSRSPGAPFRPAGRSSPGSGRPTADGAQFPDPHQFDITRSGAQRQVAFQVRSALLSYFIAGMTHLPLVTQKRRTP